MAQVVAVGLKLRSSSEPALAETSQRLVVKFGGKDDDRNHQLESIDYLRIMARIG